MFTYIFLHDYTLFAIISIRDTRSTTDGAFTLRSTVVAFITNSDERAWSDIGITNNTLTVAFFTKAPNSNAYSI